MQFSMYDAERRVTKTETLSFRFLTRSPFSETLITEQTENIYLKKNLRL